MFLFGPPDVEKLKNKRNIRGLIKALKYKKDPNVPCAAAEALGQIRDARAVEPLARVVWTSFDDTLQRKAAEALVQIGDAQAIDRLVGVVEMTRNIPDDKSRGLVLRALEQIDPNWMKSAEAKTALRKLVFWGFRSDDSDFRKVTREVLEQIDPDWKNLEAVQDIVREHVSTLNNNSYWDSEIRAAKVRSKLNKSLPGDESVEARALEESHACVVAAEALGEIGDERAVESLIRVFNGNQYVQKAAMDALVKIGIAIVKPLTAELRNLDRLAKHSRGTLISRALEIVLEHRGADVAADDLRVIARLKDDIEVETRSWLNPMDDTYETYEQTVTYLDCSDLRRLAQQELTRRGLEV